MLAQLGSARLSSAIHDRGREGRGGGGGGSEETRQADRRTDLPPRREPGDTRCSDAARCGS